MPNKPDTTKRIWKSVRIPAELDGMIKDDCKTYGIKYSDIIVAALESFLTNKPRPVQV